MTLEDYQKMFKGSKSEMTLTEAANYIHQLKNELPMLPKASRWNHHEYIQRLAQRTACDELEAEMRQAPTWKDYREIFASIEWPFMRKMAKHSMEDIYNGPDGKKRGEADAWIVEMWSAYHDIFLMMPGFVKDDTPWQIREHLLDMVKKKTEKFRRNL